ncbi:MAG TPA: coenzyme F420-0:L-glutamate ligase [Solirubrobacterales bacterium]|nr:coenzyme F420-0:L-glutamate ligase [Solirubrobacterales bacterium]
MSLTVTALPGIPEIGPGDDLARLIAEAVGRSADYEPADGDVVVIAQKVVSKAEDRVRRLSEVQPGDQALELALAHQRDPRFVQAVLDETRELLRHESGVLITETHHGFICANAGIDASNVPIDDAVLLLPKDPDESARRLRHELQALLGVRIAVVITDSFGRAWRVGQNDIAIGCAGLPAVLDIRGSADRDGRELTASVTALADETAAAANLVRQKDSGEPVSVICGLGSYVTGEDGPGAVELLRERSTDLFR